MTDFATLSYTSTREVIARLHTEAWKRNLFRLGLPA